MGSDLTGHLASAMGRGLTASIVHNSGIRNIGKLVGQMGGSITGESRASQCRTNAALNAVQASPFAPGACQPSGSVVGQNA